MLVKYYFFKNKSLNMSDVSLPMTFVSLPGPLVTYWKLDIDGEQKFYLIEKNKNRNFFSAFCKWTSTIHGEKKFLLIVKDVLEGMAFFFKEMNKKFHALEIAKRIKIASKSFFLASCWTDIKRFLKNYSKSKEALPEMLFYALMSRPNKKNAQLFKKNYLVLEKTVFSGIHLLKGVLKIIQDTVKTPFASFQLILKTIAPGLDLWKFSYDWRAMEMHLKEKAKIQEHKQQIRQRDPEGKTSDWENICRIEEITRKNINYSYIAVALDILDLAMAVLGFAACYFLGVIPLNLNRCFELIGFVSLLAACGNKISKYMFTDTLKEIKEQGKKAQIMQSVQDRGSILALARDGLCA